MTARLPCAATQDLDRYLDQQERDEQRAEAVDARCALLMAPGAEYWPLSGKAICEALGESDALFWSKLATALLGDSRSALGCDVIRAEAENYWAKLAIPQAESEIDAERANAAEAAAEARAEDRRDHEREFQRDWSAA